ncbi:MAG: monovalent cation/H+ antiporter subunit D family protein [bacterium]|nr:cation:proton antiporter [Deltaproteobacteria bacterium]MCP4904260.1 monovalent cation/H+ antiporter subunit D family protein [bacterium]
MNDLAFHFPALQVLLPLIGAPVCFLLRREALASAFTVAISFACFAISTVLLCQVLGGEIVVYEFGGWSRPFGIEYRVDITNALVLVVISFVAAVVFSAGPGQARRAIPEGREYLFYSAALLCLTGLLGVTITGDVFNVFVFLEISSLSSYILIALGRERRAIMAAFSYLIMGTIGATFLLIGIGLMYQMTGTLNMVDMAHRLQAVNETRTILVAVAFVVVGISTKLAVFPLHQWLPNAYSEAPPIVSAFLASTATKVAYYLLLRFCLGLFGAKLIFETIGIDTLLLPLSALAMFVGSIAAIYQTDFKRLLAYSSIAQIGYMTLGLSLATEAGVAAGLIHVFNHALMKGALFLVAACVTWRMGSTKIASMRGLGQRMPLAMAALVTAGLALIGVPGTAGFVSKWALVRAALDQDALFLAFLVMASSVLAVVYIWRLVEAVYFAEPDGEVEKKEAPLRLLIPTWILAGATIYFGFFSSFAVEVANLAAAQLFATGLGAGM